jgi:hypothetical protein
MLQENRYCHGSSAICGRKSFTSKMSKQMGRLNRRIEEQSVSYFSPHRSDPQKVNNRWLPIGQEPASMPALWEIAVPYKRKV